MGGAQRRPTDDLRQEHDVFLKALALLESLGERLGRGQPADRSALAWLVGFFSDYVDRCHHGKEEQHLFPALERRGIPRQGGPVGVMLAEHEQGRALLRRMKENEAGVIAEAIRLYARLLRSHIDKENNILFTLAEQVVPEAEQGAIAQAFDAVERATVGPEGRDHLFAEIARLRAPAER
jgi:hemerythrin-like domain-containing protein